MCLGISVAHRGLLLALVYVVFLMARLYRGS